MLFRGAKTIEFRGIKKVEPEPNISECGFKQTFIRNSLTADGSIIWRFEALQPEILAHCFFSADPVLSRENVPIHSGLASVPR